MRGGVDVPTLRNSPLCVGLFKGDNFIGMCAPAALHGNDSATRIQAGQDKAAHRQLVVYDIGYIELPIAIGDAVKADPVAPEQRVQLRRKSLKRTCFDK